MIEFYVDGGMLCRFNPCPKGVRWSIYCTPPGKVVLRAKSRKYHTNNEAEWLALIGALRYATEHHPKKSLRIFSDSRLIVNQFNGRWRVKDPRMIALYNRAHQFACTFPECYVTWRPRAEMVKRLGH